MSEKTRHHRIVAVRHGGPEVLQWTEEPIPQPQPGEARVRVLTAGVSAYDLMVRRTRFPAFIRTPFTPGCDLVGVVDALGEGVTEPMLGQRVAALSGLGGGCYAEQVCLPAKTMVPVPDGLDAAEAVCLVANYLTAHSALHRTAQIQPGEHILVHGAAGGVGSALVELGRVAGLEMYGTASAQNHDLVRALGATPIDYRREDFVRRVRELTGGEGVDAAFDHIGGLRQVIRSGRAVRRGGRLVWFGVAATKKRGIMVIPGSLLGLALVALLPNGVRVPMTPDGDEHTTDALPELFALLALGQIEPIIQERIPLREARRAHELLERGRYAGKVVLVASE